MRRKRIALATFALSGCLALNAQIFINTGNPNLNKYKNENPNAVIWENGKSVPIPPNTPEEPKAEPVKKAAAEKKEVVKTEVEKPAKVEPVKTEPVKVTPVKNEPVKAPVAQTTPPAAPVKTAATVSTPAMDYPPNAIPGKCYARCMSPDQYEIKEEQVLEKAASVRIDKTPAKYETIYDTVVVKAASTKTVVTPAQYEMVTEDVLVSPAAQKWVKGVADKNCLSVNPKDCEVWCLKEISAVYKKETHKKEKVAAVSSEVEVPAVTKVIPRKRLIEAGGETRTDIPAVYKTTMKKVLVKKGGFQEWKEVLCETAVTDNKIMQIQKALQREGYDPGPLDNQMGGKTKEALVKFQQDKGLPVGNLNMETLKALGINE